MSIGIVEDASLCRLYFLHLKSLELCNCKRNQRNPNENVPPCQQQTDVIFQSLVQAEMLLGIQFAHLQSYFCLDTEHILCHIQREGNRHRTIGYEAFSHAIERIDVRKHRTKINELKQQIRHEIIERAIKESAPLYEHEPPKETRKSYQHHSINRRELPSPEEMMKICKIPLEHNGAEVWPLSSYTFVDDVSVRINHFKNFLDCIL